uniref:Galectin n=1 Tax=Acrobeloides nanus TaxID=290746 RepID=A0A914CFZ8_9BILA
MKIAFFVLCLVLVACWAEATEKKYIKYIGESDYLIPFKTRVPEPFKVGHTIHASGFIIKDPTKITFNLHKGHEEDADIPLHLSIRFDKGNSSGIVVFNTFQNGNWNNKEQRISSPFKGDFPLDLRVRILEGKYQVFGNRKEIGTFDQRLPLEGIDHVSITGSLARLSVFHYGGAIFPNPYSAIAKLTPGKRLDISALPKGNIVRVELDIDNRTSSGHPLRVSIQKEVFDDNEGNIIYLSHGMTCISMYVDSGTGNHLLSFTLNKDEIFDLTIINEEFGYQIFLNGKHYCTFAHRGSPTEFETLKIDGHIVLHSVTISTL